MKRFFIILIAAGLFGGVAFARGADDLDSTDRGSSGRGMYQGTGYRFAAGETVTMSGKLRSVDGYVILETADAVYSVSAPGFPMSGAPMPVNETVQVSGWLTSTAIEDCPVDAQGHMFVESALFGGEEYTFSAGNRRRGGSRTGNFGSRNNSRFSRDGSGWGSRVRR